MDPPGVVRQLQPLAQGPDLNPVPDGHALQILPGKVEQHVLDAAVGAGDEALGPLGVPGDHHRLVADA